jgi:hypothetical protein
LIQHESFFTALKLKKRDRAFKWHVRTVDQEAAIPARKKLYKDIKGFVWIEIEAVSFPDRLSPKIATNKMHVLVESQRLRSLTSYPAKGLINFNAHGTGKEPSYAGNDAITAS